MDTTTAAASTLTRQRISVAVLSLAATATLGYFCYRVYNPPLPDPPPDRRLHRSNAVRHRRRSLPNVVHAHSREPSEASSTSVESQADADENVDLTTVRPLTDAETVADEHVLDDNWYDDSHGHYAAQQQRAGQNIVTLLFRVSEDNARRNAYVHRGCQCNGCGLNPIRGIRYRCANCADFDLCEACESQGLHTKTHIFYKIKVPIPRLGARPLQPAWYPGDPENCLRLLPKHLMAKLSRETGFERPELEALWEQWTFMANTEWREDPDELGLAMDRKTFERYLVPSGGYRHIPPNLLHDRMFAFYDENNDDLIGFAEFLRGTAYRKRKDRLRRVFKGYDIDGDGYISRRDCLRLFRAYYILFKHMHRDVLDGLDDQVLSSAEVEQLVTGRQPLSSFFGRDGGFRHADTDRPMEGKVTNLNTGQVHITDGTNRAVNEDTPDTADRQSILNNVYTSEAHHAESAFMPVLDNQRPSGGTGSMIQYLNGLLNPPTRVSELPALLLGETRDGGDFLVVINGDAQNAAGDPQQEGSAGGEEHPPGPGANGDPGSGGRRIVEDSLGLNGGLGPEGAGQHGQRSRSPPAYRPPPTRRQRVNARRKLFDRWKMRQFYLDEEEGMLPPEDWNDDHDVLADMNGAADGPKTSQLPISSRSRSSSKVRFAEDTDDFDIRSNPSTSSRSVPERWGGMEIPDAERDVGKEIFYQVIQQAFNEILDTLFKVKEELALRAAETKKLRDKYRHTFESINPFDETETDADPASAPREDKSPQDMSLQELLASSGYSVDEPATKLAEEEEVEHEDSETSAEDDGGAMSPLTVDDEPAEQPSPREPEVYRDPTMPQFRPNSLAEVSDQPPPSPSAQEPCQLPVASSAADASLGTETTGPSPPASHRSQTPAGKPTDDDDDDVVGEPTTPPSPEPAIPRSTLKYWKVLDLAEQEAKARGGWGRLSYAEFERIYRKAEAGGARLDYLGTWIDFCIPST